MSAYVIFYVKNVTDPAGLAEYKRLAGPTLKQFGGEFRVLRVNSKCSKAIPC